MTVPPEPGKVEGSVPVVSRHQVDKVDPLTVACLVESRVSEAS